MKKIVAIISQKGGVGKSTLAQAFTTEMVHAGFQVLLADCDPQQLSSFEWAQLRNQQQIAPPVDCRSFATIAEALACDTANYDLLVIDGPARFSAGSLQAAQVADLVLQPTGASRFDLIPAFREFNGLTAKGVSPRKLWLVITRLSNESEFTFVQDSCQASAINYFQNFLFERPSYKQTSNEGKTITENPFQSLQSKAFNLMEEISKKLYAEQE